MRKLRNHYIQFLRVIEWYRCLRRYQHWTRRDSIQIALYLAGVTNA